MKLLAIIIFLFLSLVNFAQETEASKLRYVKDVISFLAADSMLGRAVGSEQEVLAADFILKEFKNNKRCKVSRQKFQFKLDAEVYNSQNIVGYVNNHAKKTILFSAHYDHLGLGGSKSQSKILDEVHNGADDNASGISLLLSLIKALSVNRAAYNFLFVAYSGHEVGLYGSKYFAKNLKNNFNTIELVVNFDMVGRLNNKKQLYYDCKYSDCNLNKINIESINFNESVIDRINTLDTKWLVNKGVPSITFSTGRHLDYHKTTDDIEYINFEGILMVEEAVKDWLTKTYLK